MNVDEASPSSLAKDTAGAAAELVTGEIELARDDLRRAASQAAAAAAVLGLSAVACGAGFELMLLSYAFAHRARPKRLLAAGLSLVTLGGAMGALSLALLPTGPIEEAKRRIAEDVEEIKGAIS